MSIEVPFIILSIALPVYFICKWIIGQLKIGNDGNRKFLAILPTIVLSPMIYSGIVLLWVFSVMYYPSVEFDQSSWFETVDERYKMSEDLIESQLLLGKTQEEVLELLGDGHSDIDGCYLRYELGHVPRLFNIDPDFLEIKLEDSIVVSVRQFEG